MFKERSIAIFFSFILVLALVPGSVFASSHSTTDDIVDEEVGNITVALDDGFCSINDLLSVKELSYAEATAIQGIVQQDVATSAEQYRGRRAVEELGALQETESQKLADSYNLYFMGPDGVVEYSEVIGDQLRKDNGWIYGTQIDGRVEYGGKMAEDLAICPELTINETKDGICTKKIGETTDDFHLSEYSFIVAAENKRYDPGFGGRWIDIVNSLDFTRPGEEVAWGEVRLSQSRLKGTSWVTSMAVFPGDGITFVLPRTYMYFTSRMKDLGVFDAGTQFIFIAHALGSIIRPVGGALKGYNLKRKAGRIKTRVDDAFDSELIKLGKAQEDFLTNAKTLEKATSGRSAQQSGEAIFEAVTDGEKVLRGTAKSKLDNLLESPAHIGPGPHGAVRFDVLHPTRGRVNVRYPYASFDNPFMKAAYSNPAGRDSSEQFIKAFAIPSGATAVGLPAATGAEKLSALTPFGYTQDFVSIKLTGAPVPRNADNIKDPSSLYKTLEGMDLDAIDTKFFSRITPDDYFGEGMDVSKALNENIDEFSSWKEVAKVKDTLDPLLSNLKKANLGDNKGDILDAQKALQDAFKDTDIDAVSNALGEASSQYTTFLNTAKKTEIIEKWADGMLIPLSPGVAGPLAPKQGFAKFWQRQKNARKIFKDDKFFGLLASGDIAYVVTSGRKATALATGIRLVTVWARSLYNVARPITLMAYGLHLIGLFAESEGFLSLATPGITLEWNGNTTGQLFTPLSYTILIGRKTSIPGLYAAGKGGYFLGSDVRGILSNFGMEPTTAAKYSDLGDNLIFGGILYENYPGFIEVEQENAKGVTMFKQHTRDSTLLSIRNWENHAFTMLEDPTSMKNLQGIRVSSLGMRTSNMDLYTHLYRTPDLVEDAFPKTWSLTEKLTDWGFQSQLMIASSAIYMLPLLPVSRHIFALSIFSTISRAASSSGSELITAQTTDMSEAEKCVTIEGYKSEIIDCEERKSCEEVEALCEAKIGAQSAYLAGSGITQMYLGDTGSIPLLLGLGIADYVVMEGFEIDKLGIDYEGKIEATESCMQDLLVCNERSFMIIGGASYQNPAVLAEEQKIKELDGLPGLEQLPIDDFINAFNVTDALRIGQQQINIHSEMEQTSGRILFEDVYYVHLKDATINFLEKQFPIHLCPLNGNDPEDEECVTFDGEDLIVGGQTLVSNLLVPFKWMDTELASLFVPNTAILVDTTATSLCNLATIDVTGTDLAINPSVIAEFNTLDFEELERTFGQLRDIETDKGAIYPTVDYNGGKRFEMDHQDGSFRYSIEDVEITAGGRVKFREAGGEDMDLEFRSAIFTGGTMIKKGKFIYILPKYFAPAMSAKQWAQITQGRPFVSPTGETIDALDIFGNLIGLDATAMRIPNGEKLGILTAVDAIKDLNGDGKIQDDERSGWRFYTEDNETKFDLFYNGVSETYDADQIEIDEKTGEIKVYEQDKPHVEANLIRSIETKVDALGRTLMTIKDGAGNTLLEEALITYLKGTGGTIRYDSDNNNYVFVNGQPVQVNNDFKTNGFNAVTGVPEPPLLQPSAVDLGQSIFGGDDEEVSIPSLPSRPEEGLPLALYILALLGGFMLINSSFQNKRHKK